MSVGIHIIADFYGVDEDLISKVENMKDIFEDTVKYANLSKISSDYYQFKPNGASGIVLISESHLSFHTWPEYKLVTLDIYTCGDENQAFKAYEFLKEKLKPEKIEEIIIRRGNSIEY